MFCDSPERAGGTGETGCGRPHFWQKAADSGICVPQLLQYGIRAPPNAELYGREPALSKQG